MSAGPAQLYDALSLATNEQDILSIFEQILVHPHIFSFSTYASHPVLKKYMADHPEISRLTELFKFGTIKSYLAAAQSYPALNDRHLSKLRFLTLLSLTSKSKLLPRTLLMDELAITDQRQLEDLIIEAICTGLIRGRIDEKNHLLRVDFAESRDLSIEDLKPIVAKLDAWSSNCESTLKQLFSEMQKADKTKADAKLAADTLAQKVQEAKNAMKSQAVGPRSIAGMRPGLDDDDMHMPTPVRPEKKHKGRKGRDEL